MNKKHTLKHILKLTSTREIDSAFDLLIANSYFAGQFDLDIPVEESRDCWEHLKKIITKKGIIDG